MSARKGLDVLQGEGAIDLAPDLRSDAPLDPARRAGSRR